MLWAGDCMARLACLWISMMSWTLTRKTQSLTGELCDWELDSSGAWSKKVQGFLCLMSGWGDLQNNLLLLHVSLFLFYFLLCYLAVTIKRPPICVLPIPFQLQLPYPFRKPEEDSCLELPKDTLFFLPSHLSTEGFLHVGSSLWA